VRKKTVSTPLGTAGAVLQNLDSMPEHFFVLNGDVMVAVDMPRMARQHLERRSDFTALVHPNDHPLDSDLLEADEEGWVTAVHAYPHPPDKFFANLANAAVYVVRRDALRPFSRNSEKLDLTKDILCRLVAAGSRVLAYRSSEYIKDMGTPARLQRVEADWQAGKISLEQSGQKRPTVFLDRDGTLNVEKGHLRKPEDMEMLPGVGEALKSLRQAGFRLVVLTNQSVIARGEASESDMAAIHRRLQWELGKAGAYLDGIYVCPHHPDRGFQGERADLKVTCGCRKPATGLFDQACRDLHVDVAESWMVGDQSRDIEMARRAGLRSVLIQTGAATNSEQCAATADHVAPHILLATPDPRRV
jgi:D,D-heptose 1,7-bisphosphate phosphatase